MQCEPQANVSRPLVQIGAGRDYVVALAGNPNTGKSTIFNHLTGLRQHTGNWPGKTVARAEGTFTFADERFKLVDLPGTYSLLADSVDEEIARDFVLFGQPDCTVVVCDATVLERNLLLVLQVLEISDRVVVCANLMDEADRKKIALEARLLERELGVPVVPTAARSGQGLDHLCHHVWEVASGRNILRPKRASLDPTVGSAVDMLASKLLDAIPNLPCPHWVALRLLDGDEHIERALTNGELVSLFSTAPSQSRLGKQSRFGKPSGDAVDEAAA
ncbi:MAG: FeoB small GTPase domain-containing protein [Phycisphaerae bacterium]